MSPGALNIDGDRARLPSTIYDHDGFRRWARSGSVPEDVRVSYLDGEVFLDMSPESTETHNKPKTKITQVLAAIVDDEDLGESYSDRMLLTHQAAKLSTEPDFLLARWETFESGRLTLVEKAGREDDYIELEGTPDLVVEIVSDSSVKKDTELLPEAYHRAGIPELWLLDLRDGVSFRILHRGPQRYDESAPDGSPQRSEVLHRSFHLSRQKNRLGRWRYALDVV